MPSPDNDKVSTGVFATRGTRSITLAPDLAEAKRARTFVAQLAADAGFTDERAFEIQVACSEAVANAIEHAPVKGQVLVKASVHADRLEVQVEGPGEFQTPDRLKDHGSRGLGLPLMARLSDHLALYSTPRGGTLVGLTFYLPGVGRRDDEPPLPPTIRELMESTQVILGITENAPVGIYVLDPDLRFRWANPAFRSFLDERHRNSDVAGLKYTDVVPGAHQCGLAEHLQAASEDGTSATLEECELTGFERGATYWRWEVRPLTDRQAAPPYDVLGVMSDITRRRRSELEREGLQTELAEERAQLQASMDLIAGIVEGTPDPIAAVDTDLKYVALNQAYRAEIRAIFGGEVALGDSMVELLSGLPEDRLAARDYFTRALEGETVLATQAFGDPERSRRYYELRVNPIRNADGQIVGAAQIARDVTRERESRLAERERARLAAASNRINDITSSTLPYEEMLQAALEEMGRSVDASSGSIAMRDDGSWVTRFADGMGPAVLGARMEDDSAPIAALMARLREPVVVQDAAADSRVTYEAVRRYKVRSVVVAPLIAKGEVVGALYANRNQPESPFSPAEVDFVRRTANSMSLAIENATAFASLQRELARVELLSDVAGVLARSLNVKDVAVSVLQALAAKLQPHVGSFYALAPDGRTLEHLAFLGYPRKMQAQLARFQMDDSTNMGYALIRRLPYLTHEDGRDSAGVRERTRLAKAQDDRWIILPLQVAGQVLGAMVLTFPGVRPFRPDEIALFQAVSSLVSVALRNARLYEEQKSIAENLQATLLSIPERVGRLRLGHLYRSATVAARVGGDFYDVFEVKDGKIAVMIGDVSGHGIKAARTATLVRDVVHAFAHQSLATDQVMEWSNDLLLEKELPGFVTLFLGILDGDTGELRYSSAGHPEMLVRRTRGGVDSLRSGSPPLGVRPEHAWKQYTTELGTGDVLLLFTDGIVEARCDGKQFGEERLISLLGRARIPVERLPQRILDKVLDFSQGTLVDDAAVLALSLDDGADGLAAAARRFKQEKLHLVG